MSTGISGSPLKLAPLREPGQSLRNMAIDLVVGRLLPSLWLMSIAWVLALQAWLGRAFDWQVSPETYALVAFGLSVAYALQFYFVSSRVKRLQLGRDGERLVGEFLEQHLIPHGARIVHDVPADGFNLDHVVVAPQGVFVIETKTRTKPLYRDARVSFDEDGLLIAGHKPDRDPIGQVQASSRWLSELLQESTGQSTQVRAAVVFPGWEPKSLPAFLIQEPPVLSEREVTMFANHLTRYVRARERVDRSQA